MSENVSPCRNHSLTATNGLYAQDPAAAKTFGRSSFAGLRLSIRGTGLAKIEEGHWATRPHVRIPALLQRQPLHLRNVL